MKSSGWRPSPALIVAIVALVLAAVGTAFAANLITTSEIKNGTIKKQDLSAKLKKSLKGKRGPQGPPGEQGDPGEQGPPGLSGLSGGTIPSGTTVTGGWGGRYIAALAGTQTNSYLLTYSFPLPAPVRLTDSQVQFGAGTASPVGDADPACSGSVAAPTAPAGMVCIYSNDGARDNSTLTGFKLSAAQANTDADAHGFTVRMINVNTPGTMRAEGTWAYTAP